MLVVVLYTLFQQVMSIKIGSLKEISQKYSTFFFDLDGVIWKGKQKIQGGIEALKYLRNQNKRMFFLTNSSLRNRAMLKDKFKSFDFDAEIEQIIPSAFMTALYIKKHYHNARKVLVFGAKCLADEIRQTGANVWHYTDKTNIHEIPEIVKLIDKEVDVVVVGYDYEMSFTRLALASFHLQRGAKLLGTNPDKFTMEAGFKVPGNGSMLTCLESASGVKAEVVGKPNTFILNYLIQAHKVQKEQCLMIGDNLETDIQFGGSCGIETCCVLTGNATQEEVKKGNTATYYCQKLL